MQRNDKRPPTAGRPSLLSSEQQAEAERHRILSGLDERSGTIFSSVDTPRSRQFKWLAFGVTVLALSAGTGALLSGESEKAVVIASTVPGQSSEVLPPAFPPETMAVHDVQEEASTAAILEDAPATAPVAVPPEEISSGNDEVRATLERGASAQFPAIRGSAPREALSAKRPKLKIAQSPRPPQAAALRAKKKIPADRKARAPDSDVALLAALVAHSKATQPKRTPAAIKLNECKTLGSVSHAEECRARLCDAAAKDEPECKGAHLAKASPGP